MNRVVLGCGYVGKALLEYWQPEKNRLVATTTQPQRQMELEPLANEVMVLRGNDRTGLRRIFSQANEVVVCVAPKMGGSYEETYLDTAKAVCDILREATPVKHLIYTSSISVYGCHNGEWVTEESSLNASGANAEILKETEKLYLSFPTIKSTILRLGGIYGPQREHETRARKMSGTICAGNGEQFSNWVHQEDIVRSIDWVLKHRLDGVYNVCSDDHPTRQFLYERILNKLGLPPIQWDLSLEGPHGGNRRVSSEKLKATGFNFLHNLSF
jgi:nucleoside-diphosphate-sugar epimerase